MSGGAWGYGLWGGGSWGGGPSGSVAALVSAEAVRENVVRVEFSAPIYFSGLLDPFDASRPDLWSVTAVSGTTGYDGEPARSVLVAKVLLPDEDDGIDPADVGRYVDVYLDRAMSPFPSRYVLASGDLLTADLADAVTPGEYEFDAVYRRLQPPQPATPRAVRDLANPMEMGTVPLLVPIPTTAILGVFSADSSGDYAFDEWPRNLKKRVYRRIFTRKGGFAHLPNYGVGILSYIKRLGTPAVMQQILTEIRVQVSQEPDVAKVAVRAAADAEAPGLYHFRVVVKSRDGRVQAFDVPVSNQKAA